MHVVPVLLLVHNSYQLQNVTFISCVDTDIFQHGLIMICAITVPGTE